MLGGVVDTDSTPAFAETTFGLRRSERRLGSVRELDRLSVENRRAIGEWIAGAKASASSAQRSSARRLRAWSRGRR